MGTTAGDHAIPTINIQLLMNINDYCWTRSYPGRILLRVEGEWTCSGMNWSEFLRMVSPVSCRTRRNEETCAAVGITVDARVIISSDRVWPAHARSTFCTAGSLMRESRDTRDPFRLNHDRNAVLRNSRSFPSPFPFAFLQPPVDTLP